MATPAPAAAKLKARLLPMRLEAPVTRAVLGCRLSKLLRQRRLLGGLGAVRFALGGGVVGTRVALAVERVLLTRPLHLHHDLFAIRVDLVVIAVGFPAVSDHLQAHRVTNGDYVDGDLALFIALEFQGAFVLVPFHRVEDDSGVGDRLTVGRPQDDDLDGGGRWRRGIFAPRTLSRPGTKQRKPRNQEHKARKSTAKAHGEKYR